MIVAQVRNALEHAHGRGWIHLDVRPSNIIVDVENTSVQLIDWGCAAHKSEKLQGFRGCYPYAHEEVLRKSENVWHAREEFDWHPFVFTIATLAGSGRVAWDGFMGTDVDRKYLESRKELAIQSLVNSKLGQEDQDALFDLLRPRSSQKTRGQQKQDDEIAKLVEFYRGLLTNGGENGEPSTKRRRL